MNMYVLPWTCAEQIFFSGIEYLFSVKIFRTDFEYGCKGKTKEEVICIKDS